VDNRAACFSDQKLKSPGSRSSASGSSSTPFRTATTVAVAASTIASTYVGSVVWEFGQTGRGEFLAGKGDQGRVGIQTEWYDMHEALSDGL